MLAIFDFDGTLVDSLTDLVLCTNYALEQNGFPTHPYDQYRTFVGDGLVKLLERVLPEGHRDAESMQKVKEVYDVYYNQHKMDHSGPYKGIVPMLRNLKKEGIQLAVLSNKPHEFTRPLVDSIFPGLFDFAYGKKPGYQIKPDPATALEIIAVAGVEKNKAVMIGDTWADICTGKNAGIYTVGVAWGFRGTDELKASKADEIAENCTELEDILLRYLKK